MCVCKDYEEIEIIFIQLSNVSLWACIFTAPPVVWVNCNLNLSQNDLTYYRSRITFVFVFFLLKTLNIILATKCRNFLNDSISINKILRLVMITRVIKLVLFEMRLKCWFVCRSRMCWKGKETNCENNYCYVSALYFMCRRNGKLLFYVAVLKVANFYLLRCRKTNFRPLWHAKFNT